MVGARRRERCQKPRKHAQMVFSFPLGLLLSVKGKPLSRIVNNKANLLITSILDHKIYLPTPTAVADQKQNQGFWGEKKVHLTVALQVKYVWPLETGILLPERKESFLDTCFKLVSHVTGTPITFHFPISNFILSHIAV